MATKVTGSNSSVGKESVHHLTTEATREHVLSPSYSPRAPLPDEVSALARKVFLKFDLILVLPTLIMFCKRQCEYL